MMSIEDILDEMENLLLEASRVPFTDKRVIEEDDLAKLLDDLRDALPRELQQAREMLSQRQQFLEQTKAEAQKIMEQAKAYCSKMTDEDIITKQAQEQADAILNQARQSANTLQNDAVNYAGDVFVYLENTVGKTLETVKEARTSLQNNKQQTHNKK